MNRRAFLDAVLREVNALRAAAGLEPLNELPKGQRCMGGDCPLARAFGEIVYDVDYGVIVGGEAIESPLLRDFVRRFDAYEFPHLVEQPLP